MKLDQFKLLTDENIQRDVVQFLRAHGFDVLDPTKEGLFGRTDVDLLQRAVSEDRVVVTTTATLAHWPFWRVNRSWGLSICDRDTSTQSSPSKRFGPY